MCLGHRQFFSFVIRRFCNRRRKKTWQWGPQAMRTVAQSNEAAAAAQRAMQASMAKLWEAA